MEGKRREIKKEKVEDSSEKTLKESSEQKLKESSGGNAVKDSEENAVKDSEENAVKDREEHAVNDSEVKPEKINEEDKFMEYKRKKTSEIVEAITSHLKLDTSIQKLTDVGELLSYSIKQQDMKIAFIALFHKAVKGDQEARKAIKELKDKYPILEASKLDFEPEESFKVNFLRERVSVAAEFLDQRKIDKVRKIAQKRSDLLDGGKLPNFLEEGQVVGWLETFSANEDDFIKSLYKEFQEKITIAHAVAKKEEDLKGNKISDELLKNAKNNVLKQAEEDLTYASGSKVENSRILFALLTLFTNASETINTKSMENPSFMALLKAYDSWKGQDLYDIFVPTWIEKTIHILMNSKHLDK
ncbi:expressed protein [Phakopsora pachyrhizi]|uniref:Expressed protein n=1 Tax=Phakopsora pachyrhizi TaxID=170000 RepID=A0AAV0ALZ7_PHAPC|nr:expressed protein [Phakopsora pachyrhizi]